MVQPPLLQLSDISLTFGGGPVFDSLDLVVQPGDRVALVGRNGSGKSTLMKVMAGLVEPDRGAISRAPGTSVGYMEQDPDLSACATLGDYAGAGLDPAESYKIDIAAEGLGFDPELPVASASVTVALRSDGRDVGGGLAPAVHQLVEALDIGPAARDHRVGVRRLARGDAPIFLADDQVEMPILVPVIRDNLQHLQVHLNRLACVREEAARRILWGPAAPDVLVIRQPVEE